MAVTDRQARRQHARTRSARSRAAQVGVLLILLQVSASPLLAVLVVAVKMLYVEDVMDDHPHVPGDPPGSAAAVGLEKPG